MAIEIKTVEELIEDSGIKAILYGATKYGKTTSIATIPNQDKVLIITLESGLISLKEKCPKTKAVAVYSLDDLREVYAILENSPDIETVVIDSLTEVAQVALDEELKKNKDGRKAYGEMMTTITRMVKKYRDIPKKNVIFICQQERISDSQSNLLYAPSFPGTKLSISVPFIVDVIACIRVKRDEEGNIKRRFQLEPCEQYTAGYRSPYPINAYEPCDWSIIFNKIKGNN